MQSLRGSVLGTVIEKAYSLPSFGEGLDEFSSIRPIGLHSHANSLANWTINLFFIFPLFYPFLRKKIKKDFVNKFFLILYLSLFFVLVISLSRSAYLALIISFLFLLIFEKKFLTEIISYLFSILEKFKLIFLIISFFVSLKIGQRLYHSFYSFSGNGGFSTRTSQFQDAFSLIKMNPLFGFGIGMFIPVMFYLIPGGEILSFPENVHNGFLLFIAERGIISFLFSLLAIFFLLRAILLKKISGIYKSLFIVAVISNFTMMIFQPFDNMMSLNIMMSELILLGEKNEKK
jgi:O-antigen ligase